MMKLSPRGVKDQKSNRMRTRRVCQNRGIRGLYPRSRVCNSVGEVIAPEGYSINRMIVLAADNVVDAEHGPLRALRRAYGDGATGAIPALKAVIIRLRFCRKSKTRLRFSEESVPAKEKKTQADLIALLMGELRKHSECDHVVRVVITQPVRSAPHHPNWDVAWTVGGNEILCPAALRIASELQAKFDLA